MKLRGYEVQGSYYVNTSNYPHIAFATASCSEPNNIDILKDSSSNNSVFYSLVPGYKYKFECRGQWHFIVKEEHFYYIGRYGNGYELLPNGHYTYVDSNWNNGAKDTDIVHVHRAYWTNQDTNHKFTEGTAYAFLPTSLDGGGTVEISVNEPCELRCECSGMVVNDAETTTLANYKYEIGVKLTQISDMDGTIICNNYSGYYEPSELSKYLSAYWQSLEQEDYDFSIRTQQGTFYIEYGDWINH